MASAVALAQLFGTIHALGKRQGAEGDAAAERASGRERLVHGQHVVESDPGNLARWARG